MFFLSRLDRWVDSGRQGGSWVLWRQGFTQWLSDALSKLPAWVADFREVQAVQATLDEFESDLSQDTTSLRLRVLEAEDAIWCELGPTGHPATNRTVHSLRAGQAADLILERELSWGRCLQEWQPLLQTWRQNSEASSSALVALRAELQAFQSTYLELLRRLVLDLKTLSPGSSLGLDELTCLGRVYSTIDIPGFCRRSFSGPTEFGLLNCYLKAAWLVHQSCLSHRVFSVIKAELMSFLDQLTRQQELLLAAFPRSRGLSLSLSNSLRRLPELCRQIDLMETADLQVALRVESASCRVLQAYDDWNATRKELLVVSGSQDEELWLTDLWQDCQAVFFESSDVSVLRIKVSQIRAVAEALGHLARTLAGMGSEKEVCLSLNNWSDDLRRRLDFVELFADQPTLQTLRIVRQELIEQLDRLENIMTSSDSRLTKEA